MNLDGLRPWGGLEGGSLETADVVVAGIPYDGHPSFVARETGTNEHDVFMMLCFGKRRIVHTTLHISVREAIASITRENVTRVIHATDRALRRLGIEKPIC